MLVQSQLQLINKSWSKLSFKYTLQCWTALTMNTYTYEFAKYPVKGLNTIWTKALVANIHPILLFSVAGLNDNANSLFAKLMLEKLVLGSSVVTLRLTFTDCSFPVRHLFIICSLILIFGVDMFCIVKQSAIICSSWITSISGIIGTAKQIHFSTKE